MMTSSNLLEPTKAAICIKEMAAQVGLSRQRFMQLVKAGVFEAPLRDAATGRPFFTAEAAGGLYRSSTTQLRRQRQDRNVLRTPPQSDTAEPTEGREADHAKADCVRPPCGHHGGVGGLGLTSATREHVADAVKELFPRRHAWNRPLLRKGSFEPFSPYLRGKNTRRKCEE